MKSQLEGAGLGLPLQGGAWGHDPGSREPRREDAFREEAAENTHTQQRREGGKETNSRRPKLAQRSAWAADSWGPTPRCRQLTAYGLRDPARPSPQRPSAGGAWTWTREGSWAWGAEGPTALGEYGPSQVPREGKLRHGREPARAGVKCLLDSAPISCFLWGGAEITLQLGVIISLMWDSGSQRAVQGPRSPFGRM